jgi:hypothetical protein
MRGLVELAAFEIADDTDVKADVETLDVDKLVLLGATVSSEGRDGFDTMSLDGRRTIFASIALFCCTSDKP